MSTRAWFDSRIAGNNSRPNPKGVNMTTSTAAATVTSIIRVDSPEDMARNAHLMGMQQMYLPRYKPISLTSAYLHILKMKRYFLKPN